MTEQVYIIGAGAIGKALAVFLTHNGANPVLIRGSVDHEIHRRINLGVQLNDGTILRAEVPVSGLDQQQNLNGILIITTKSMGNVALAERLAGKVGTSPIVILQNGLDIEHAFLKEHFPKIYRCVLFATSQPLSETLLQFKPVAPSPIGWVHGDGLDLARIISVVDTRHFPFKPEPDISPIVWRKVIANCVFNSICPVMEVDNGIFYRNDTARALALEIISECVVVANTAGIRVSTDQIFETVLNISKASEGQFISTLQDIRNKRPTEIETLNFAIVNAAIQMKKGDSVIRTKLLGELIKLKSALNMQ